MSVNRCLFVVQVADLEQRSTIERRLRALASWYRKLGPVQLACRRSDAIRLIVGGVTFDGQRCDMRRPLVWGNRLPAAIDENEAFLSASPQVLRALPTPLAAVAAGERRARLVTAAGGLTALFSARSNDVTAWSSHAVAASWLATESATIDPEAILELIAAEYVAGGRTIIAGVSEVPPATSVTFTPKGTRSECFWPPSERWDPLGEEAASATVEQALADSLQRHLVDATAPVLGLTAGLDSRILAVMLKRAGGAFSGFTYAESLEHPDVSGARIVAERLNIPHHGRVAYQWANDEGLARLHTEVRWHEAGAPAWFGGVPWPSPLSHWVTGLGAETGRSFYYRWLGQRVKSRPSDSLIQRVLIEPFTSRIVGAYPSRVRKLRARWRGWLAEGRAAGLTGWRVLDFVYAEQRVRRWGRGLAPRLDAAIVPGYAAPEVLRALTSLPLQDRLEDGFGQRFLRSNAPELAFPAPAPVPLPSSRVSPLTRLAAFNRLRATHRRVVPRWPVRRSIEGPRWFEMAPWDGLPSYIGWLIDDVLRAPLLDDAGGASWREGLRERFIEGAAPSAEATVLAASAVALNEALRELGGNG